MRLTRACFVMRQWPRRWGVFRFRRWLTAATHFSSTMVGSHCHNHQNRDDVSCLHCVVLEWRIERNFDVFVGKRHQAHCSIGIGSDAFFSPAVCKSRDIAGSRPVLFNLKSAAVNRGSLGFNSHSARRDGSRRPAPSHRVVAAGARGYRHGAGSGAAAAPRPLSPPRPPPSPSSSQENRPP